jgi:TonB-linked SusC/RagA family outer membrane protein
MTLNRLLALSGAIVLLIMVSAQFSFAQVRTITGKVTDSKDGTPVSNASVTIKGAKKGTTTGSTGAFTISVENNDAVLVISSVGYAKTEVKVGDQKELTISLNPTSAALNEVVVVGYGTQRKKDLTGAVTKIGEKDFNQGPISSPLQQINGRAAGVTVTQTGSEPGVAPGIRIRGVTSLIGGSDPLVVVDGIQGNLDLFNQIPPGEIESMDILKDASATAIYGSRGAAGVLLVTTKKGKAGKTTLEYNVVASFEEIAKKYELLSADEWRAEAKKRLSNPTDFGANTDWFNAITRKGFQQNHNLAFSGGAGSFNYRASLTAILQDGIVINSGFKNYIGRFQATQKALDNKLTLTMNLNSSITDWKYNGPGAIGAAYFRRPTDPIYKTNPDPTDRNGPYFIDPTSFGYLNPYARAKEIIDGRQQNSLFGSFRADLELFKGLTAGWFGSWRKVDGVYGGYQAPRTTIESARNDGGIANRSTNLSDEKLTNLSLNYRRTVKDHSFDVIGVYEWQKAVYEGFSVNGRGYLNDFTTFNALQTGTVSKFRQGDMSGYKNDQTLISFLGRLNYSYKGKYLATASFRRDGSSKFGANNKWANFPSVNLAWRVSQEDFMMNSSLINDLKFRVGYGVTGNQQGLGPLNSVRLVSPSGTTFFGGSSIPNFAVTQNENKDLRWETRRMFNAGVDFSVLKNKLSGTIDVFTGETRDLLFNYNVPQPPYPFNNIKANVGTILNQGVEISLNYNLISTRDWNVTLAGNFTSIRTEVKSLSGSLNGIPLTTDTVSWGSAEAIGVGGNFNATYLIAGQPIGTFFLPRHAGVDGNGNQIIEDYNKDGKIDFGDRGGDRVMAGQVMPKFTWAFTPTVTYKNLDLNLVVRGAHGNKIYNNRRAQLSMMDRLGTSNVLKDAPELGIRTVSGPSDLWLEDGGFVRIENVTLGYRIPLENVKLISALRLYVTGNNLAVFTKYSGIDPEVGSNGSGGSGIDFGIYPRVRSYAIGLNVTFK